MSLRSLAKDSAVYGLANVVNGLVASLSLILLARVLAPADYALIALVTTVVGLIATFGTLSLNSGVQFFFFKPDYPEARRDSVIATGTILTVICLVISAVLVVVVLGPLLSFGLLSPEFLWLAVALAIFGALAAFLQDLRRLMFQPWKFAVVAIARQSVGVGFGLLIVYQTDLGVAGFLVGSIMGAALALVLGSVYARGDVNPPVRQEVGKDLVRYSWPLAIAGGATWVLASIDVWVIAASRSDFEVGQFAAGRAPATAMMLVVQSVVAAWSPTIMRAWKDGDGFNDLLYRFSIVWSATLVALSLLAGPAAVLFLTAWLPADYWPGVSVASVLLFSAALHGTVSFTALGLTLTQRTRTIAVCYWGAALLATGTSVALIPSIGLVGAAASMVVAQVSLALASAWLSRRAFFFTIPVKRVMIVWLVGLASSVSVANSYDSAEGVLGATAYAVSSIGFGLVLVIAWKPVFGKLNRRDKQGGAVR